MLLLLTLPAFARDFLQVDAGAPGMAVQVNLLREGGAFTGSEVLSSDCADLVVVTSDNPRSEDPLAIINDALVGLRRTDTPHLCEPDRERAIRRAIAAA